MNNCTISSHEEQFSVEDITCKRCCQHSKRKDYKITNVVHIEREHKKLPFSLKIDEFGHTRLELRRQPCR